AAAMSWPALVRDSSATRRAASASSARARASSERAFAISASACTSPACFVAAVAGSVSRQAQASSQGVARRCWYARFILLFSSGSRGCPGSIDLDQGVAGIGIGEQRIPALVAGNTGKVAQRGHALPPEVAADHRVERAFRQCRIDIANLCLQ